MKVQSIEFTNTDNSTNQITIFRKEGNTTAPIMLILPAMGVWAKFYKPLAEEFANQDFIAATVDLRGNGTSSVRPDKGADFGYKEMLNLDYEMTLKTLKQHFPNNKIYLLGHSLGGQLGCLYLSKNPTAADGLILTASCSVYYKGWTGTRRYGTLMVTQFFNIVSKIVGYMPGKKLGFGGTEAKTVISDWSRQARTGKYLPKNDNFDYEKALKNLEVPTLVLTFEADTFAPPKAAKHLYRKLKNPVKVQHIHLKNNDERNEQFNHFSWVKKPRNIVKIVKDFLEL